MSHQLTLEESNFIDYFTELLQNFTIDELINKYDNLIVDFNTNRN